MSRAFFVTLAMLLALVRPTHADITLTIARRSTGTGPATGSQQRVLVSGKQVRIESVSGQSMIPPAGAHMVFDGDGWVVADPGSRTYWNHGHVSTKTRRFVRALLGWREPRPPLTVDGIVVERLREKDGGTILGHPTRLQRCRLRFRLNVWPVFATSEPAAPTVVTQDEINEIWFAPSLQDETLRRLLLATGFADTDEQLARALAPSSGLPLRRFARRRSQTGSASVDETTNVMEVERIDLGAVPASAFEPPAGYRRVRWEDALARQHATAPDTPAR